MSTSVDLTLTLIELLALHPSGLPMRDIAQSLALSPAATRRLTAELCRAGWLRLDGPSGRYGLSLRISSIALSYLHALKVDVAQPVLDRLGGSSRELVRVAAVEGGSVAWLAAAREGGADLRYEPEMGLAPLFCTATGHAWLSCLDDHDAISLLATQGFARAGLYGPMAPRCLDEVLVSVQAARQCGYAIVYETYATGISEIAAPIRQAATGRPLAALSIEGPLFRLTAQKMQALVPELLAAAAELSAISLGSLLLNRGRVT